MKSWRTIAWGIPILAAAILVAIGFAPTLGLDAILEDTVAQVRAERAAG